jgi:hypothetical protein
MNVLNNGYYRRWEMTTDIERQFFDTFGIEPKKKQESELVAIGENIRGLKRVEKPFYEYPQITDRILLELIFILTTLLDTTIYEDVFITVAKNREELKRDIFQECMLYKQHIKQQVQSLFKENI